MRARAATHASDASPSARADAPWPDRPLVQALIVAILAACAYLVGIAAVPTTDRDEPRFAQASRQMAESERLADWVIPRVGEEIRLKKPPLIYWVQAPTVLALTGGDPLRDAIWMYRLPSAIAAFGAGLLTLWLGRSMFGGRVGLLAASMLVVSPVLATDAHMARADEVLLFTTTLAMCALWRLWRMHRADPSARGGLPLGAVALLWLAVGLGILAKGPITPFVAATCAVGAAAARREWRFIWRLRPFFGLVLLAALATPWVWLAAREVGWDTLKAAFEKEVLQRAREGAEGHAAPPGYYLVTLVAFFFPGSLLTGLAFGRLVVRAFAARAAPGAGFLARMRGRFASTRGRDAEVFLFFWAVPTWLAFELVVTKFPHYILPIYPAIALFTARCVLGGMRALPKPLNAGDRFGYGIWMVVGCVLALAGPALYFTLAALGKTAMPLPAWPPLEDASLRAFAFASLASLGAVVLIVLAWRAALLARFARAMALAIPATVLAEMALFGVWIPNTRWIWNTPRVVGIVAADAGLLPPDDGFPKIAGVGYQEDSLMWATRGRLVRFGDAVDEANRDAILAWAAENRGAYLLVPRASAAEFESIATVVGDLQGFNYSDGDPVDHAVMRIAR
jgi:4-amino-4-deoxy-L-arabinose transferase-like glycosyltransferase